MATTNIYSDVKICVSVNLIKRRKPQHRSTISQT